MQTSGICFTGRRRGKRKAFQEPEHGPLGEQGAEDCYSKGGSDALALDQHGDNQKEDAQAKELTIAPQRRPARLTRPISRGVSKSFKTSMFLFF